MTDGTREVKVSPEEIKSVNEKLEKFVKGLPAGEQNVMAWLLGRAAQAPADRAEPARGDRGATERVRETVLVREIQAREPLIEALGIPQFEGLQPGSRFAGSSVGVTGTIMF